MSEMSLLELSSLIQRFLNGSVGPWEWDDFTSIKSKDPTIEHYRLAIVDIADRFPSPTPEQWASDAGLDELRQVAMKIQALAS